MIQKTTNNNKKFIEIMVGGLSYEISKMLNKENDYFGLPIDIMLEEGYDCTLFIVNNDYKNYYSPKGVQVIYYDNIFHYLRFLRKNRNAIIYSNGLTIKTLLVGLIGNKTILIPHAYIFGGNKLKSIILRFFYRFFSKIRLNHDREVKAINKIKKNLGVKVPLVVPGNFYNPNFKFQKENIFVSLGNLTKIKNPETILQALKLVKDKGYDFKLKVIGEDRLKQYCDYTYTDLLCRYGLKNNVEVLGFVPQENLPKVCEGACCYLNASTSEGLCLAVYESTLMGMATILPNIFSLDGVFGDNGLYYKSGDVQDFADKIIYFLDHRDEFVGKIKKNQKKVLSEYSYDTIKSQLKDLFLSLDND